MNVSRDQLVQAAALGQPSRLLGNASPRSRFSTDARVEPAAPLILEYPNGPIDHKYHAVPFAPDKKLWPR